MICHTLTFSRQRLTYQLINGVDFDQYLSFKEIPTLQLITIIILRLRAEFHDMYTADQIKRKRLQPRLNVNGNVFILERGLLRG